MSFMVSRSEGDLAHPLDGDISRIGHSTERL